jgi:hypothetical protein
MALPTNALRAAEVMLKSVTNEGHFTLEAEAVSCPYLSSHCSGVTKKCHMALPAKALQTFQDRLKSVSNEGHFTTEAGTFIRPIYPRITVA